MPTPPQHALFEDTHWLGEVGATSAAKARFWDRIACKYAADPIADMAGYETTLERVQQHLRPDLDVLEIGCGTGTTALRLAPGTRRMLAIDVSQGMVDIAREKLAAHPVPQLSFALADADEPSFGHATFDVALAFSVLHLVTDLDATLASLSQALRPGGVLISKTPCLAEMSPLITRLALPVMRKLGKAPHILCFSAQALRSAFTRQGLQVEAIERHGTKGKDMRLFIVARKSGG